MTERNGVVYGSLNMSTGKVYIGETVQEPEQRWKVHERLAKKGSDLLFHRSIKKHGLENFCFWIIEDNIPESQLKQREIYWIDKLKTEVPLGYNMTAGGGGGPHFKGHSHTDESKEKISQSLNKLYEEMTDEERSEKYGSMKGRTHTEETKKILSEKKKGKPGLAGEKNPMFGKTHTMEARQRISEANKGKKMSEETKQKQRDSHRKRTGDPDYVHPLKGRKLTDEHKKKVSEGNKGKTVSKETRKKISIANSGENHHMYGKKHTDATKKKISEKTSGENNPIYGRTGKAAPMYGKTLTEEQKKKQGEGIKKAWAKKRMLTMLMVAITLDYRSKNPY